MNEANERPWVLITGCSSGIGQALVETCRAAGWGVVATARSLAALEPQLGKRKIEVLLPPGLPLVRMDMVLMTQVMVNLLDNALKYTPRDSSIELAAGLDDGTLTMAIADRGPGIPEHELKRVFDKFYRIPVPEGAGGTGLGLSICKGIVEAHGGSIRAENRQGGGLRVKVALPLHKAE